MDVVTLKKKQNEEKKFYCSLGNFLMKLGERFVDYTVVLYLAVTRILTTD